MADLAITFHWGAEDCRDMNIATLMDWRERARTRTETDA